MKQEVYQWRADIISYLRSWNATLLWNSKYAAELSHRIMLLVCVCRETHTTDQGKHKNDFHSVHFTGLTLIFGVVVAEADPYTFWANCNSSGDAKPLIPEKCTPLHVYNYWAKWSPARALVMPKSLTSMTLEVRQPIQPERQGLRGWSQVWNVRRQASMVSQATNRKATNISAPRRGTGGTLGRKRPSRRSCFTWEQDEEEKTNWLSSDMLISNSLLYFRREESEHMGVRVSGKSSATWIWAGWSNRELQTER